jgi:hypothetical protein
MDDRQIEELLLLSEITDEQALVSDEGGDSDAEDNLPVHFNSTTDSVRSDHSYSTTTDDNIGPIISNGQDSTNCTLSNNEAGVGSPNLENNSDCSFFPSSSKDESRPKIISGEDPMLWMPSTSKTNAGTSDITLRPRRKKIFQDIDENEPENLFSDDTDEDPSYSPTNTSRPIGQTCSNRVIGPLCISTKQNKAGPTNLKKVSCIISNKVKTTSKKGFVGSSTSGKNKIKIPTNSVDGKKETQEKFDGGPKTKKRKQIPKYFWSKFSNNPKSFEESTYDLPFGVILDIDYNNPTLIFKNIIDTDICSIIINESNQYANQKGTNLGLTEEEFYAFLGILIFMGIHYLPSVRLYWSEDENFHVSRISRVMPLKRFLKILRFLHLNNNEEQPEADSPDFDKLYKIRPLLDHLSRKYSELFAPSRFLSIDESMAAFKGRSTLKQYMPLKPIKRGFKIWAIACAVSGFLLKFEVYTGKKDSNPELGLGGNVVNFLSQPYTEQNRCLFFDNFFSSVNLFETLLDKNTFACGTIRWDRAEYPVTFMKPNGELEKHEHDFAQCQNPLEISVVKWKDRGAKPVSVISNMHNPCKTEMVLRTNHIGIRESVKCPKAVADYNRYMGGVDLFDQHMAPYSISRKSRKWWIKLFYYFIESAIVNSFILHEQFCKKKKVKGFSHLQFRSTLVNGLIDVYSSRKRRGPPPAAGFNRKRNDPKRKGPVQNCIRLSNVGDHLPVVIPTYRRCAFCSTKDKEKRSNLLCKSCGVALCKLCFAPFHER